MYHKEHAGLTVMTKILSSAPLDSFVRSQGGSSSEDCLTVCCGPHVVEPAYTHGDLAGFKKEGHLEGGAKAHKEQFIEKLLAGIRELCLNQGTFPTSEQGHLGIFAQLDFIISVDYDCYLPWIFLFFELACLLWVSYYISLLYIGCMRSR